MTDRMGNTRSVASGLSCGNCAPDVLALEEAEVGDGFVVSEPGEDEMATGGGELGGSS